MRSFFLGNVLIVSRTVSGMLLVGASNRPRKKKRNNRENTRHKKKQRNPGKIGKVAKKNQKAQKRMDKSRSGESSARPVYQPLQFYHNRTEKNQKSQTQIATFFCHKCPGCQSNRSGDVLFPKIGEKLNRGGFQTRVFPLFPGKVQIGSRTLSGLFLVGALNRPRKKRRTNRENPRTIPERIGKIPEKSGKSQKGQKGEKKKDKSRSGSPPPFSGP